MRTADAASGPHIRTYAATTERPHDPGLGTRPVQGSVILRLQPSQPCPRAATDLLLGASVRAPGEARSAAALFLSRCPWVDQEMAESAVLVVSELVTNAYEAMDGKPVTDTPRIEMSLRAFPAELLIEVIDASPEVPVIRPAGPSDLEGGRGLTVVDRLSTHWGWFFHSDRKVVFSVVPASAAKDAL